MIGLNNFPTTIDHMRFRSKIEDHRLYSHRHFDITLEAQAKAHNCLRSIGQSKFNYQRIMVGSSYFDRERFNEFQSSIVDVVNIMAKDGGAIVFAKSHRLQI